MLEPQGNTLRNELFDLAVNRAAGYLERTGGGKVAVGEDLRRRLELWYLRTRFAYRLPLDAVIAALGRYPGRGYSWRGGPQGDWHLNHAANP